MKILYYPAHSENLYAKICRECIEKAGVEVQLFSKSILTVLKSDCDGVYLQWYENLPSSRIKMCKMFIVKFVLLFVFKMKGMNIYFVMHNKEPHDHRIKASGSFLLKLTLKKADRILVMSQESSNEIKRLLGDKYFTDNNVAGKIMQFPHPNYIDEYPIGENKYTYLKPFSKDSFVFMNIGMVRPYKNLEILIKAFKQCDFKNAKLIIVGKPYSTEYQCQIEELIANNKNILGIFQFVDDENMSEVIGYSDALVFPYNKRSCLNSGAIYLACSYAKTFIAPQMGTTKELTRLDRHMYVYDYSDEQMHIRCLSEKMNEAYQDWYTDKEKFHIKGVGLQEFVRKENSRQTLINTYKNIFELV